MDIALAWIIGDGLHIFLGVLAVAGTFLIDIHLGIVTWIAAAAHEVPQELSDFGVLVHGGRKPREALLYSNHRPWSPWDKQGSHRVQATVPVAVSGIDQIATPPQ